MPLTLFSAGMGGAFSGILTLLNWRTQGRGVWAPWGGVRRGRVQAGAPRGSRPPATRTRLLTFAGEAVDEAQEAQQADFVARVSEVGPGGVDVAGGTALLAADVRLQHQAAGGLSALLQPAHAACATGGAEGDSRPPPLPTDCSLCRKLLTNPQRPRPNAPSDQSCP